MQTRTARRGVFAEATEDLVSSLRGWRIWWYGGVNDVVARYRRTMLGPLWNVLANVVLLSGMAFAWSTIFGLNVRDFLPRLYVGYIVWQYLMVFVFEGTAVFTGLAAPVLRNVDIAKLVFPLRLAVYGTIVMLHNMVVALCVVLLTQHHACSSMVLFIPAITLTVLNGVWMAVVVGTLCARFRDLSPLISSVVSVGFLLAPIVWDVSRLHRHWYLAYLNPFTFFIQIVRSPLLCTRVTTFEWTGVIVMTVVGWIVALGVIGALKRRIVFWL